MSILPIPQNEDLLSKEDKKLFEFFTDINGILDYKDGNNVCQKLYDDCQEILDKDLYSNINVQNNKGNTFLHYAFKTSNTDYVLKLLHKGANPYIENNNNINVFCFGKTEFAFKFWESIKDIPLDSLFSSRTKGFHPQFKQAVFEDLAPCSHIELNHIASLLKENQLFSINNTSILLRHSVMGDYLKNLNYFMTLKPTSEENSFFLAIFTDQVFPIKVKDRFQQFLQQSTFSIDGNFLECLQKSNFHKKYEQNLFSQEVMHYLIKLVAQSDTNLDKKYPFSKILNSHSYNEFFKEYPAYNNIYLYHKLQLNLKKDKLTNKAKIKI